MLKIKSYGEKIYLCLVKYGALSAAQIHQKTNIPQNRIYDSIVSLENEGLVEVQPTEPKLFKAKEPKVVFQKEIQELKDKQEKFQKIYENQNVSDKEKQIWITQGHEAFVRARMEEFQIAKKEVCAMVGKEMEVTTDELTMINREHKKALERNIKTRFLWNMEQPENVKKARSLSPLGSKIRHFPVSGFTMVIIDDEKVRIDLPDRMFENVILWIDNKDFAKSMKDYFEKCWEEGKNWKKFDK
jgi:sugar-specific transcriptional regulator TrmB